MPAVSFRTIEPADLDVIFSIEKAAHKFPWTRDILAGCLRPDYCCLALEVDGKVEGFLIMSVVEVIAEAHVLNVCVHPSQQGKGLGRMLMEQATKHAEQRGIQTLFLEVRESNAKAISLYDSLGFNEIGLREGYYPAKQGREDAIVMAFYLG